MFGLSNDLYFFGKVLGHPKNDFIIRMVCILFAQIEWPENKMQISFTLWYSAQATRSVHTNKACDIHYLS